MYLKIIFLSCLLTCGLTSGVATNSLGHTQTRSELNVVIVFVCLVLSPAEPLNRLTFVPLTTLDGAIGADNLAISVLTPIDPLALKTAAILHKHGTRSVLLVVLI